MKRTNYLLTLSAAALLSMAGTNVTAQENLAEMKYESLRDKSRFLVEQIQNDISYHQEYNKDYTDSVTRLATNLKSLNDELAKNPERSKPEYREQALAVLTVLGSLKSSISNPNPEFDGISIIAQLEAIKNHKPALPQQVRAEVDNFIKVIKSRPSKDKKDRPLPTPQTKLKSADWFKSMNDKKVANDEMSKQAHKTLRAAQEACTMTQLQTQISTVLDARKKSDEEFRLATQERLQANIKNVLELAKESWTPSIEAKMGEMKAAEFEKVVTKDLSELAGIEKKLAENESKVEKTVAEMVQIDVSRLDNVELDEVFADPFFGEEIHKLTNKKSRNMQVDEARVGLVSTSLNAIINSVLTKDNNLTEGNGSDLHKTFSDLQLVAATAAASNNIKVKVSAKDMSKVEAQLKQLETLRAEHNALLKSQTTAKGKVDKHLAKLGVKRDQLAAAAADGVRSAIASGKRKVEDTKNEFNTRKREEMEFIDQSFLTVKTEHAKTTAELDRKLAELVSQRCTRRDADVAGVVGTQRANVMGVVVPTGTHSVGGLKALEQEYNKLPRRNPEFVGPPRP